MSYLWLFPIWSSYVIFLIYKFICVYFIMNPIIYGKNFNPCLLFKKSNPINLPLTAHPFHLIHHWIELKGKKNCIHKLSNLKAIKFLQLSSTSSPMLRRKNSSCLWPGSDDCWEVLFCFVFFSFSVVVDRPLGLPCIFIYLFWCWVAVFVLDSYWRGCFCCPVSFPPFFVSFHPFLNEHFPI